MVIIQYGFARATGQPTDRPTDRLTGRLRGLIAWPNRPYEYWVTIVSSRQPYTKLFDGIRTFGPNKGTDRGREREGTEIETSSGVALLACPLCSALWLCARVPFWCHKTSPAYSSCVIFSFECFHCMQPFGFFLLYYGDRFVIWSSYDVVLCIVSFAFTTTASRNVNVKW